MKYTVKTVLNNVIQNKEGEFTYNQKLVSMKWEEKAKRDAVQSGKGPGEFGPDPDYSDRKRYHLTHGEPPLVNTDRNPRRSPYPSHVIEAYMEPIKRSRTTPLTKEEIEMRHAELKRKQEED